MAYRNMDNTNIIIYTRAYNAGKTLSRCIDSILNQTLPNFKYYIVDNGSNDRTRNIIDHYSKSNEKIIPLYYDENKPNRLFDVIFMEKDNKKDCYLCTLDADDEYAPDFLEKMLSFIKENDLEVATCGTSWVDRETGDIIKHKVIDKTLVLEGADFADLFPYYRNFMVTIWGAVYSLDLLKRCDFEWFRNAQNFSDTAFCMETFRRAKRAGIFAGSLHKYYISQTSLSYEYNPNWFQACKYIHRISREYLLDYGEISKDNEDYLCILFFILLKYIISRIQFAEVDLYEKLKSLRDIFSDDMTQYVIGNWEKVGIYSCKKDFLNEILTWLLAQEGLQIHRQIVDDIIISLNL